MIAIRPPSLNASSRSWLTNTIVRFRLAWSSSSSSCRARADQRIECREWLVHEQDRRFRGECPRKPDTLLHAARQFGNLVIGPVAQTDEIELRARLLLAFALYHAVEFETESDIVQNIAPWQQAELLEHHGDAVKPHVAQCRGIGFGDVGHPLAVIDQHRAAHNLVQPVDRPKKRGFSGTGKPISTRISPSSTSMEQLCTPST
jgi:hypothetical protein